MEKPKRIIRTGDMEQTDQLLNEIAHLYRERLRALYNHDTPTLQSIAHQIDTLKSKLAAL